MEFSLLSARNSALFQDLTDQEIEKMKGCLSAREARYKRETFVFRAGDTVRIVYFILSGSVHIINEDFWGNRSIIETMGKDMLFGEAYVFSEMETHLVSIVAAEDCVLLEIDPDSLFEICSKHCDYHIKLFNNVLRIVSGKIVRLTEKIGHIVQRTIREKVLSYLSKCAQREKSSSFEIPYSRQQLADYLCVDRSALSHELSRLQKEGIIRYHKHHFELMAEHGEY